MSKCYQIQPIILLFDNETPNAGYLDAFCNTDEFYKPRICGFKCPPTDMIKCLGREEAIIRYNNIRLIEECAAGDIPYLIVYNCAQPMQNIDLTVRLVYKSCSVDDDIVFYSYQNKPTEECEQSACVKCSNGEMRRYFLYRLFQCISSYAYLIKPCGARCIINYVSTKRADLTFNEILTNVLETSMIHGLYFYPALFTLDREEIKGEGSKSYWWIMLFILLLLVLILLGIFIYCSFFRKKEQVMYYKRIIKEPKKTEETVTKKPLLLLDEKKECKVPSSIVG